jgi:hypothetical protein
MEESALPFAGISLSNMRLLRIAENPKAGKK